MRVLLLPSVPYERLGRLHAAGEGPRPTVPDALLARHGITTDIIDPGLWPLNPFGRMHSFYRAFDPIRAVRALLHRNRYDLLVCGNESAAALLVAARRLVRITPPILIWDISPSEHWRARRFVQDRTLPKIDGLLALNEVQVPYVAARWGAHVPVHVVGHWVDTEFYRPEPDRRGNAVLVVGDDVGRDYPTLLLALAGVDTPVRIRTGLPLALDDTKHRAVEIIRQRLSAPAFRDLYAGSRFVVVPLHPAQRNASGVGAVMEAGAMGKAAIVSESDGIREFVRHEETALVVPGGDPVALRGAIERLLREPETCARLGQGARAFMERTASPAVFADRLAVAYWALAGAKPRHPEYR